jgi:hypothetical protein
MNYENHRITSDRATDRHLERIEDKIDKLSEAMIDLARAEEKIINIEVDRKEDAIRMRTFHDVQQNHEKRMSKVETTISNAQRLFWLVLSAGIMVVITEIITQNQIGN